MVIRHDIHDRFGKPDRFRFYEPSDLRMARPFSRYHTDHTENRRNRIGGSARILLADFYIISGAAIKR
jgi:hypothetical protein